MTAKTKERKYSVFDFDKLGKKALVAPFCLVIVLACVLSLAVAPLLQASPHDVSLAIVNLDEGVSTPAGTANAGAMLASQLTGEEDEAPKESATAMAAIAKAAATASGTETAAAEAPATSASAAMADSLTWETFDTEDELHAQLDDNNVFGGIVIPADFTAQQLAAKSGGADKPHLTVYLNMNKNPQVASSLQTAMAQSLASAGVDANIEMVNNTDVGGGMMASLVAVQMLVMPLLVMTMSSSLILAILTRERDVWDLRARSPWLAAGAQVVFVALLSALIAGLSLFVDVVAGGLDLPVGKLFLWLWLGCACVMLAFAGLADAYLPLGALFAIGVFVIGMGTAMLPAEMMPTFWADWVFPWAPQAHLGQGVRTIVYCGQTPSTTDAGPLLAFAVIGAAALLLAAGLATAKQAKTQASAPAAA